MLEFVKTPTNETFFSLIANANNDIVLCAPFIKEDIVSKILTQKNPNARLTVMTSSNIANFVQGSSDIRAIDKLIKNDVLVKNFQNLHAKIYMFDKEKALITSANLTHNGMNINYEYGVLVQNDYDSMIKIIEDYEEMQESELCGQFSADEVQYLENTIQLAKKEHYKIVDDNGDKVLNVKSYDLITKSLTSWEKDVFDIITTIEKIDFGLADIYKYKSVIQLKHPSNHNVEAKIRQMLQHLRDRGIIKFTERGKYKKLFLINKEV